MWLGALVMHQGDAPCWLSIGPRSCEHTDEDGEAPAEGREPFNDSLLSGAGIFADSLPSTLLHERGFLRQVSVDRPIGAIEVCLHGGGVDEEAPVRH